MSPRARDLEQDAARLHQVARLGVAGQDRAGDFGADGGFGQLRPGIGEPRARRLFAGIARHQRTRGEARLLGRDAGHGFGLRRLFHGLARDHLALEQVAPARRFTAGLGQSRLGFAQAGLGLRPGRLLQLGQLGLGFAHRRLEVVGAQDRQHVARPHRVAFAHAPFQHHRRQRTADLGARDRRHPAGGHHGLHHGPLAQLVGGQLRPAHAVEQPPGQRSQDQDGGNDEQSTSFHGILFVGIDELHSKRRNAGRGGSPSR